MGGRRVTRSPGSRGRQRRNLLRSRDRCRARQRVVECERGRRARVETVARQEDKRPAGPCRRGSFTVADPTPPALTSAPAGRGHHLDQRGGESADGRQAWRRRRAPAGTVGALSSPTRTGGDRLGQSAPITSSQPQGAPQGAALPSRAAARQRRDPRTPALRRALTKKAAEALESGARGPTIVVLETEEPATCAASATSPGAVAEATSSGVDDVSRRVSGRLEKALDVRQGRAGSPREPRRRRGRGGGEDESRNVIVRPVISEKRYALIAGASTPSASTSAPTRPDRDRGRGALGVGVASVHTANRRRIRRRGSTGRPLLEKRRAVNPASESVFEGAAAEGGGESKTKPTSPRRFGTYPLREQLTSTEPEKGSSRAPRSRAGENPTAGPASPAGPSALPNDDSSAQGRRASEGGGDRVRHNRSARSPSCLRRGARATSSPPAALRRRTGAVGQ